MIAAITGAGGFIGTALSRRLAAVGWEVLPIVRRSTAASSANTLPPVVIPDLRDPRIPPLADRHADVVFHLAASARTGGSAADDPTGRITADMVAACETAIKLGAALGAKHFVHVSSLKALGEHSEAGALSETAPLAPTTAYGRAKADAERIVQQRCAEAGMEWTIVRPPMVYGRGGGGNFAALGRLVRGGWPLPFGDTRNRRSLVAVENLVDALASIGGNPASNRQIFHVTDNAPLSTTQLIQEIGLAVGRRPKLIALPAAIQRLAMSVPIVGPLAQRLFGNLEMSDGAIRNVLGWAPPYTTSEAIRIALTPDTEEP